MYMDDLLVFTLFTVSVLLHKFRCTGIGIQVRVLASYICMGSSHTCSLNNGVMHRTARNNGPLNLYAHNIYSVLKP